LVIRYLTRSGREQDQDNILDSYDLCVDRGWSGQDATIEITYKIKGASDGSVIGSTTVTNQTEYDVNTESVETRSSGAKLSVVITDVEVY
jgi:hypothetical protein